MYSSSVWSRAPTGPMPSTVGMPISLIHEPSETPPAISSSTGWPSSPRISSVRSASQPARSMAGKPRSSERRTSTPSWAPNSPIALERPVEVGARQRAHVDGRLGAVGDRVLDVAGVEPRDVRRQARPGAVDLLADADRLVHQRHQRRAADVRLGARVGRAASRRDVEPRAGLAHRHDRPRRPPALEAQRRVGAAHALQRVRLEAAALLVRARSAARRGRACPPGRPPAAPAPPATPARRPSCRPRPARAGGRPRPSPAARSPPAAGTPCRGGR